MFDRVFTSLNEWLEYIATEDYIDDIDMNHFDQVHGIYNSINVNVDHDALNKKFVETLSSLIEQAFCQYKIIMESLYDYDANTRVTILFENLLFQIDQLGFSIDDDDEDFVMDTEEESDTDTDSTSSYTGCVVPNNSVLTSSDSDVSDYIVVNPRKSQEHDITYETYD